MFERVQPPSSRPARPWSSRVMRSVAGGLVALLAAGAVQAQSLLEVYNAARNYDATYLAARAEAESAQYAAEQAYALRRPSVGLSAGISRSETDPPVGNDRESTTRQAALQATQPLFNRANGVSIEQAERALEIARARLETAEQDLIVRVAQAYFNVLAARDTLASAQANKAAISEQLASAKRNFEVGTATITDTREAQARFDLATAQEIAAQNNLEIAQAALNQLVGRNDVDPRPLAAPVSLPSLAAGTEQDWVQRSENAPGVRQAALALQIAELETEKARAGHLPTLDLVGEVGRSSVTSNNPQQPSGHYGSTSVGVQLRLPLFAGFAVQNRVRETLALEEKSRNELDAARRQVALATRQAYSSVQSGLAQVRALEAAEASSKLALEATQLGYKVGVRVNLDVLNAQTQLFNTQSELAQARYNVLVGSLRLRQAAGVLAPDDLAPINALLAP